MIPLNANWNAFWGLHGGIVLAWLLEEAEIKEAHSPTAITAHFLSPVAPEIAKFEIRHLHQGRTTGVSLVALHQNEQLRAHAVVSSASTLGASLWDGPIDLTSVAKPTSLERFVGPVTFTPVGEQLDIRPINGITPGSGADRPDYEAWVGFRDSAVPEALGPWGAVAVVIDALPPGLLALWTDPSPVPTVELSAHFAPRASVLQDWYHVRHRTVWANDSVCVDETELRDMRGDLIAQARQSRRVLSAGRPDRHLEATAAPHPEASLKVDVSR